MRAGTVIETEAGHVSLHRNSPKGSLVLAVGGKAIRGGKDALQGFLGSLGDDVVAAAIRNVVARNRVEIHLSDNRALVGSVKPGFDWSDELSMATLAHREALRLEVDHEALLERALQDLPESPEHATNPSNVRIGRGKAGAGELQAIMGRLSVLGQVSIDALLEPLGYEWVRVLNRVKDSDVPEVSAEMDVETKALTIHIGWSDRVHHVVAIKPLYRAADDVTEALAGMYGIRASTQASEDLPALWLEADSLQLLPAFGMLLADGLRLTGDDGTHKDVEHVYPFAGSGVGMPAAFHAELGADSELVRTIHPIGLGSLAEHVTTDASFLRYLILQGDDVLGELDLLHFADLSSATRYYRAETWRRATALYPIDLASFRRSLLPRMLGSDRQEARREHAKMVASTAAGAATHLETLARILETSVEFDLSSPDLVSLRAEANALHQKLTALTAPAVVARSSGGGDSRLSRLTALARARSELDKDIVSQFPAKGLAAALNAHTCSVFSFDSLIRIEVEAGCLKAVYSTSSGGEELGEMSVFVDADKALGDEADLEVIARDFWLNQDARRAARQTYRRSFRRRRFAA